MTQHPRPLSKAHEWTMQQLEGALFDISSHFFCPRALLAFLNPWARSSLGGPFSHIRCTSQSNSSYGLWLADTAAKQVESLPTWKVFMRTASNLSPRKVRAVFAGDEDTEEKQKNTLQLLKDCCNGKEHTLVSCCFGFGCRRQQKRHAAAPPPAGVGRRMERKRQKLVGRDKGSLTEQQREGNRNNNDTNKEKTQPRTVQQPLSRNRTGAAPAQAASAFPQRRSPPHRNPAWRHMVWNTGLCLARWGQPPPAGCAPSWSPVKINPVLAKPRTVFQVRELLFGVSQR